MVILKLNSKLNYTLQYSIQPLQAFENTNPLYLNLRYYCLLLLGFCLLVRVFLLYSMHSLFLLFAYSTFIHSISFVCLQYVHTQYFFCLLTVRSYTVFLLFAYSTFIHSMYTHTVFYCIQETPCQWMLTYRSA